MSTDSSCRRSSRWRPRGRQSGLRVAATCAPYEYEPSECDIDGKAAPARSLFSCTRPKGLTALQTARVRCASRRARSPQPRPRQTKAPARATIHREFARPVLADGADRFAYPVLLQIWGVGQSGNEFAETLPQIRIRPTRWNLPRVPMLAFRGVQ